MVHVAGGHPDRGGSAVRGVGGPAARGDDPDVEGGEADVEQGD